MVFTGLSGSGKSSLAFDTLFAEGQRRYMETFSAYARQFIGDIKRPAVDFIEGLSPVIAIEQKTVSKNPRSTVGTITEIYDFLRLLYARVGDAYCYANGNPMKRYSEQDIITIVKEKFGHQKLMVLAPVVKGRKGHYREVFEQFRKKGYTKARVDGNVLDLEPGLQVDRYKVHDIELVVDRLSPEDQDSNRLVESIRTAIHLGKGVMSILLTPENITHHFSTLLMDVETGIAYDEPQPNLFSFNSPYGACPTCDGLGAVADSSVEEIIPNPKLSIKKGGLAPLGEWSNSQTFEMIQALSKKIGFSLTVAIEKLDTKVIHTLLYGYDGKIQLKYGNSAWAIPYETTFEGIIPTLVKAQYQKNNTAMARWADEFLRLKECTSCLGGRLNQEALSYRVGDKSIAELGSMSIGELNDWLSNVALQISERQAIIAKEILKEIQERVKFLIDVGLDYLSINSPAKTLSGGEAQRIRLATQIGSKLEEVLYILDEPSIGLHQRDNEKLIYSLKELRDLGNSVIVVEHDRDMIVQSDYVVDIGPGAGKNGGQIVAAGTWDELKNFPTLTADYLTGKRLIEVPKQRRKPTSAKIEIKGCTGNNLKDVNVKFPLGLFIAVTGVSGSGKSTLINETLNPILSHHIYKSFKKPLAYQKVKGLEEIDKVITIDQSPIGRTPRSNPATYVGFFTEIRTLYAELPEAKIRGYKPGRFSFNVKGGRCETCGGGGQKVVEMNFLPNVLVTCEGCNGKRYNRETLEIRYKGKNISDVLEMTVDEGVAFFEAIPTIYRKILALQKVGLGYITLGQSSTTLSGGEAQRVKLSSELSKISTGRTFYVLDEPTTGLHFEDIKMLLEVLNNLVSLGNTVLVIEHNLDVIKVADWLIDMGPEGGQRGGQILFEGTPEALAKSEIGFTAKFLKELL